MLDKGLGPEAANTPRPIEGSSTSGFWTCFAKTWSPARSRQSFSPCGFEPRKNYQTQCKIMISVHVDLPISQRLPKFQGRVLPDLDCSQASLTPFSPIEVIEIEPRRIESRTRFGVCHEYIVVSDRDTCNGLLNFRVRHTPYPIPRAVRMMTRWMPLNRQA